MLITQAQREKLDIFFQSIRLSDTGDDRNKKVEQIIAYLEIIQSQIRMLSYKRKLTFVDSGAGNCYLSFLVAYYYTHIDKRDVEIHCVDWNERLMENNRIKAKELGFKDMSFHGMSIEDFALEKPVDLVYSLHACDTATDLMLHLGMRLGARTILSVSCCQRTVKKDFRASGWGSVTRHRVFKDRLVYMIADAMRVLLLESGGYRADVIEFVSSRHTDKNVMIRATKSQSRNTDEVRKDYEWIQRNFHMRPKLEEYLNNDVA